MRILGRRLSPATLARCARGKIVGRLVRRLTPAQAFPTAEVTHLGEGESVATPDLSSLPLAPACAHLRAGTYQAPRPYACVLPGVIHDPAQNQLWAGPRELLEQADQVPMRFSDLAWPARGTRAPTPQPGLCTTLRSFRDNHYHLLVDMLPQLHLLEAWRRAHPHEPPIRLLIGAPLTPAEAFFLPRLLPAGVELTEVGRGELHRTERLLFVSFLSRRYAGYLPGAYLAWLRERLALPPAAAAPAGRRRLFVSRGAAHKGRRIINEAAVMDALAAWGFERVVLEDLPVPAQIAAFADLECVVAAHGAGLANLMFSPCASVVELFPQPVVWPHFHLLSRACGHRHAFVTGHAHGRDDDFAVDLAALRAAVERTLPAATATS